MRGTKLSTFVRKGKDARSSQADLPHYKHLLLLFPPSHADTDIHLSTSVNALIYSSFADDSCTPAATLQIPNTSSFVVWSHCNTDMDRNPVKMDFKQQRPMLKTGWLPIIPAGQLADAMPPVMATGNIYSQNVFLSGDHFSESQTGAPVS